MGPDVVLVSSADETAFAALRMVGRRRRRATPASSTASSRPVTPSGSPRSAHASSAPRSARWRRGNGADGVSAARARTTRRPAARAAATCCARATPRSGWTAATAASPNLQQHIDPGDLTAVVITHEHPDHCVDIYGLHVLLRYGARAVGRPRVRARRAPRSGSATLVANWGDTFAWHAIDDGDKRDASARSTSRFSRTDHPPPTFAVEATAADGRRLVYTVGHRPGLERRRVRARRRPRALRGDATCTTTSPLADPPLGPPGRRRGPRGQARSGSCSPTSGPRSTRRSSVAEGSEAFGEAVTLAVAAPAVTEI